MTHPADLALASFVANTTSVIQLLLLRESWFPNQALIVICSAIDTAGLIEEPTGAIEATKSPFTSWCEKRLVGQQGVTCSPLDLYAARRGVLHTHGSESRLSRSHAAKEIAYLAGDPRGPAYRAGVLGARAQDHVPVDLFDLANGVCLALAEMLREIGPRLSDDPKLGARAMSLIREFSIGQIAALSTPFAPGWSSSTALSPP